jgi:preprotein translocase subunit SecG
MLIILVQKGRGEGLTGAFGGGGGSSAFGAKTGDVFTWITVVVAAAFLLLNVVANFALDESPKDSPAVTTTTESPPIQPESEPGEGTTGIVPVEIPTPGEGGEAIEIKPVEVEESGGTVGDAGTEKEAAGPADDAAEPAGQPADTEAAPPEEDAAKSDEGTAESTDAPEGETEETPSP